MSKFIRNAAFTLSVAVISFAAVSIWGPKIEPIQRDVQAATSQTDMRIYAYLLGDWSGNAPEGDKMYITYENTAITNVPYESAVEMTRVVSGYYEGLFYYDVPIGFDDDDQFRLRNSTGAWTGKDSDQTEYIYFKDLNVSGNFKGISVGVWDADNTPRVASKVDTIPMSSAQYATILNHINSCSTSYAVGYNSWPQLYDLFVASSTLEGTTVVDDNYGPATTIAGKNEYLETRYTIDQAS